VHQQPVAERHASEAQLVLGHRGSHDCAAGTARGLAKGVMVGG
jgi:hypothetical protein